MTCRDLGGACDRRFRAESFEKMAELSRQHAMEMFKQGEPGHLEAMEKMRHLMIDPQAMAAWFKQKQDAFDALPDDPDE